MYQAHYHGPGFDLVQVALQIRQVVRGPEEKPSKWLSTFRQATRQIVATPSIDCAVRFATKGKRLERTLLITAPEHAEDRVQYLAGVILQLNAVVDGSVLCALNRTQHDEITSQFPKICGRLSIEPVEMNRCWLTHDFRMFSQLELLMAEALHREVEAAWQINARYSQANSEDTRALRKNLVLIESESSIPARVAELQRKIWNHMEASSFLIDELVGFKSESDSRRIQQILGQQFAAGLGRWDLQLRISIGKRTWRTSSPQDFTPPISLSSSHSRRPRCLLRLKISPSGFAGSRRLSGTVTCLRTRLSNPIMKSRGYARLKRN